MAWMKPMRNVWISWTLIKWVAYSNLWEACSHSCSNSIGKLVKWWKMAEAGIERRNREISSWCYKWFLGRYTRLWSLQGWWETSVWLEGLPFDESQLLSLLPAPFWGDYKSTHTRSRANDQQWQTDVSAVEAPDHETIASGRPTEKLDHRFWVPYTKRGINDTYKVVYSGYKREVAVWHKCRLWYLFTWYGWMTPFQSPLSHWSTPRSCARWYPYQWIDTDCNAKLYHRRIRMIHARNKAIQLSQYTWLEVLSDNYGGFWGVFSSVSFIFLRSWTYFQVTHCQIT